MAEVVFQNLEGMLPELEELEKQGVFSREEIRIIVKRRTEYEYKLQKRIVEKQDILNYLEYELKLNILQKKRSKRMKLKLYSTAALSVTRRIHTLFRKALMKFGDDMKLWVQYIDFCKKTESTRALEIAFGKLIQQHASNPEVWLMASKHEFEEGNNTENARSLLQRALRQHKQNKKLWLECFRLELLHVDKIKKRRKILGIDGIELKESSESEPKDINKFLANKTAFIVFENAINQINGDIAFCLEFVEICQAFEETDELEDQLYNRIKDNFPSDEAMYEALAKQPLSKLKKNSNQIITDEHWKRAEDGMEEKFQEAIEKFNTDVMWEKYVNTYADLLRQSSSPKTAQRRMSRIISILKSAEKNEHMTESMYIFWSDLLLNIGEITAAGECLRNALKAYKTSPCLWQKYLILKAEYVESWSEYQAEFKKSFSSLKEPNLLIWQVYVEAALSLDNEDTKLVFEEAVKAGKDMRDKFLPQYLEWIVKSKGIQAARKFYKRFLKETLSYEFLVKYLEIEKLQETVDKKCIRMLFERLIDDYGKTNTDIWLNYIQFEREFCGDEIERPGMIYLKAKRTLGGKLNSEFLTKYSLINTET